MLLHLYLEKIHAGCTLRELPFKPSSRMGNSADTNDPICLAGSTKWRLHQ
jgi:hypothetical protein